MVPAIHVPIAPGDTVELSGDSVEGSPFEFYTGRILQVFVNPSAMIGGDDIPIHPQAYYQDVNPIALLKIAITKSQSLTLFHTAN